MAKKILYRPHSNVAMGLGWQAECCVTMCTLYGIGQQSRPSDESSHILTRPHTGPWRGFEDPISNGVRVNGAEEVWVGEWRNGADPRGGADAAVYVRQRCDYTVGL